MTKPSDQGYSCAAAGKHELSLHLLRLAQFLSHKT